MRIELSDVYLLGEAFERAAVRADFTCSSHDVGKWLCGECTQTITLKQYEGFQYCDLMGTTDTLRLISDRLQKALSDQGVTGWTTCPVELLDRRGGTVPGYAALATSGRCGPLVNSRSPKVRRMNRAGNGMMDIWLGYYFDEESWDGSDMFRPDGTRMTLVTKRARKVIEAMGTSNITLEPILEIERLAI